MKQNVEYFFSQKNLGSIDTLIRFGVAAAALYITVFHAGKVVEWVSLLALFSAYPLVTALCQWDPLYDLAGISSRKKRIIEYFPEPMGPVRSDRDQHSEPHSGHDQDAA